MKFIPGTDEYRQDVLCNVSGTKYVYVILLRKYVIWVKEIWKIGIHIALDFILGMMHLKTYIHKATSQLGHR
jgi:hypothetical protein